MAFQGEIGRASVVVEADVSQFARGLAGLKSFIAQQTTAFGQATASTAKFNSTLSLSAGAVGVLTGALGGLAAAFSAREILDWVTAFQNVENAMRSAGVASGDLSDSVKQVFDVAVSTRAPIEEMTGLYQQLTIQTKELGLSQRDIFGLMKLVGQGIAVSGTSAEAARGALLQFGQMLGTSRVRMQEFNSVQMGAPAILRAAAAGIDKAGGSVARLRELVSAGKISNQDFYNGLQKGSATITDAFGKMVPTIAQAGTVFRDALIEVAGRTDEAAGGTRALAQAVLDLAAAMRSQEFQNFLKGTVDNLEGMGAEAKRDIDTMRRLFDARQTHDFATVMKEVWKLVEPQPIVNQRIHEIIDAIAALEKRSAELKAKGSLVPTEQIELAKIPKDIKTLQDQLVAEGGPPPSKFQGPTKITQLAAGSGGPTPGLTAQDARAAEAVTKQVEELRNKLILAKIPAGELHDFLKTLGAGADLSLIVDDAGNLRDAFKDTVPEAIALQKAIKDVPTMEGLAAQIATIGTEIAKLQVEYAGATGAAKAMIGLRIGDLEVQQLKLAQAQVKALGDEFRTTFAAKKAEMLAAATVQPADLTVTGGDAQVTAAAKAVAVLQADIAQKQAAGAFDIEVKAKTDDLTKAQDELKGRINALQVQAARDPGLRMNAKAVEAATQDLTDLQQKLADLQEAGVVDVRLQLATDDVDKATSKLRDLRAEGERMRSALPATTPGIEAAKAKVSDLGEELSRLKAAGGLDAEITAKTEQLDAATKKLADLRTAAAEPVTITPAVSTEEAERQTKQLQAAISKVFDGFTGESGMAFGEFTKQLKASVATAPAEVQAKVEAIILSLQGLSTQAVITKADLETMLATGLRSDQIAKFNAAMGALANQLEAARAPAGAAGDAIRETARAAELMSAALGAPVSTERFKAIIAGATDATLAERSLAKEAQDQARAEARVPRATAYEDLKRKVELARDALKLFDATTTDEGDTLTEAQRKAKAFADALNTAGKTQAEFAAMSPNSELRKEIDALAAVNLALLDHAEANRIAAAAAAHAAEAMEHEGSAAQLAQRKINDARVPANAPPPSPPLPVAKPLGEASTASLDQQNALMKQQLPLLQVQADLGDEQAKRDIERINRLMEINRLVALGQQGQPGGITEAKAVPLRRDVLLQGEEQNAKQRADQARIEQGGALPDKIDAANIAAQNLSQTLTDIDNLSMDSLKETFANIAKQIAQMIIQALIFRAIMAATGTPGAPAAGGSTANAGAGGGGGGMFGFAKGGVIDRSRIIPAAHGMVLHKPTLIPLAGGDTVLAREAGPEAILPLGRTPGGDLGVKTTGPRGSQQGATMAGGDTLNFDFRGMSPGAVADAMNQVYAAARRDVFKELSRSPTSRRSIGLRGGVR